MSWAQEEFGTAALGDPRRTRRLVRLVEDLSAHPTASVPTACGTWAATKAAYRWLDNPPIAAQAVNAAHQARTAQRSTAEPLVLLVQDTTHLVFTSQRHTTGLGPLHQPQQPTRGLLLHTTLAVSRTGVPLGLLDQQVWARDPAQFRGQETREQLLQRPADQKESRQWVRAWAACAAQLPPEQPTLVVADREADLYDLFLAPRPPTMHLLVRATFDRALATAGATVSVWSHVAAQPAQDQQPLEVPRGDERPSRTATLRLRWAEVTLKPPRGRTRHGERLPAVALTAVLVQEVDAPEGVTPLEWRLLTTLPLARPEAAWQVVRWYSYRWRIEQYHDVLKSGYHFERLQVDSAERLERALSVYRVVAWRLLGLTYAARVDPTASAATVLSPPEWQTLWCVHHQQAVPPAEPPPLREALRWIAELGGFLGRSRDGEPGVKALWVGWQRLADRAVAFQVLRGSPTSG